MGGDYYDRDVISTASATGYSDLTNKVIGVTSELHLSMNPQRWKDNHMKCDNVNPIVFALDVTGSMGNWSKIIYEKMPMFYGQIMMQNYLTEPSISFSAIGDAKTDKAPLQVSEFGQGNEIDQLISKMYLEGGGGGNKHESYELAAYFYDHHVELSKTEMPFFFLTGDEGFWENLTHDTIKKVIGCDVKNDFVGKNIWLELKKKYNVFLIKKPFSNCNYEPQIMKQWIEALGEERILLIKTPKACIDIILGAIAITSGSRTLDGYIKDMKDRQQSAERIKEVTDSLSLYVEKFTEGKVKVVNIKSISNTLKIMNNISEKNELKEIVEKLILNDNLDEEKIIYYKTLRLINSKFPEKVPKELKCPLTGEIFFEPYMTSDGHTFEKKAIEEWLKINEKSPITNEKLSSENLISNIIVNKLVAEFYNTHKDSI